MSKRNTSSFRPRTRGECPVDRPCPWACRYNLAYSVTATGIVKLPRGNDATQWGENCALDHAERGGMTLEEVGEAMGFTRERARQLEESAKRKLAADPRLAAAIGAKVEPEKPAEVDEALERYAERVRARMKQRGLTVPDVARSIGVARGTVRAWIEAQKRPGAKACLWIRKRLGVKLPPWYEKPFKPKQGSFAAQILAELERRGWNRYDLARALGTTHSTICSWCGPRQTKPGKKLQRRVEEVLGVRWEEV